MQKFLIIDGNSIMNRAFYGLSVNMTSSYAGIHTNAIYGFLNIYWMITSKINPDYVAVSFDLFAPTFRHKMYSEYKGTRKGMPDELKEQMPVIKQVLSAMNIPIIEKEGFEADDILGTVSKMNEKNGIFTYILTGDKDSFQLISKSTSVVIPTTRFEKTEYTIYTPELLMEKNNIEPYQVKDIKSLMGDTSDNIPGVKGIGEKTAYLLIGKYTTLENIYENIENLDASKKVIEKLIESKDMAFLSKKLATIDTDVDINLAYDDCKVKDVNLKELYLLFKKLEFNKFMQKYDFSSVEDIENLHSDKSSKVSFQMPKFVQISNNKIEEFINQNAEIFEEKNKISYILNVPASKHFASNIYMDNTSFLAIYDNKKDICYYIKLSDKADSITRKLIEKFAMSKCMKLGYNIKQDIRYIFDMYNIYDIHGFDFDIMIAYYLLDSNKSNYLLDYILDDMYDIQIKKPQKEPKQISFFDMDTPKDEKELSSDEIENISSSLKGIYLAYEKVIEKLKNDNLYELFSNIEMPLCETLASMEHFGMGVNREKLDSFDKEISMELSKLEKNIYELAGEEFNINSTQQLGTILFEKLELPTKKKTKTGYSTDKSVLDELVNLHPIIQKLLDYRQIAKLKSTYVDSLRDKIEEDGRIHTTFMQALTATGRISSVEPNLQNIPIKLELGSKIRTFFMADNNYKIVDADYSQIELRVLAHASEDEVMIKAFKDNVDIHKVTASQVFGCPLDEVTDTMRSHAKAVNFGIVYGISEFGLSKNIGISYKEAKEYISNYLEKYSGIAKFMEEIVKEAKEKGYVTTLFGRRRYIPELLSKNKNIVMFGKRVAMNTPIQGSAADIIKLAMNNIYYRLKNEKLKAKLIMQVHDELLIETPEDEIEKVKSIMKQEMENVVSLKVPLIVKLNEGKSWYDAK